MKSSRFAVILAGIALVAASACRAEPLVNDYGTGTLLHPIQRPESITYPDCYYERPCRAAKEHVYIFGVNGLNPLCLGNFNGLLKYFREEGFCNTRFGQLYSSHWFNDEIRAIRQRDPEAKIVVIGFSLGSNYVKCMANRLEKDGTKIDLLVYLVGDFVFNTPSSYPSNVCRVLNVRAKGLVLTGGDLLCHGADIDGAYNYKMSCRHILVPSRKETLELLMGELLRLACVPCAPSEAIVLPPRPVATPTPVNVSPR